MNLGMCQPREPLCFLFPVGAVDLNWLASHLQNQIPKLGLGLRQGEPALALDVNRQQAVHVKSVWKTGAVAVQATMKISSQSNLETALGPARLNTIKTRPGGGRAYL